jgi:hypothetical protein
MSSTSGIPDWKLERYLLGELPADELAQINKAAHTHPEVQANLDALLADNVALLGRLDPTQTAKRLQALATARSSAVNTRPGFLVTLPFRVALTAVLILSLSVAYFLSNRDILPQNIEVAGIQNPSDIRIKGLQDHIQLFLKTGDTIAHILEGAKLNNGDLIQIHYQVSKKCFASIISLDGRGQWTTHFPEAGTAAAKTEPGLTGFLPFAYELDRAPYFEAFWLITSTEPFSVDSLVTILETLSGNSEPPTSLPLDAHFQQTRIVIRK